MPWIDTELESPFHQFSFYDQPDEVVLSVDKAQGGFHRMWRSAGDVERAIIRHQANHEIMELKNE